MSQELLCQTSDVVDVWPGFAKLGASRQASLITRASAKVQRFCRREGFLQASFDEFYSGKNLPRIWLRQKPVIAVSAITINTDPLDNSKGDAWHFNPDTGELIRGNGEDDTRFVPWFPAGQRNVEVVYAAGYLAIPDLVIEATAATVKWLFDRSKISGVYESESLGDYSYTLRTDADPQTLPGYIADLLTDYVQDDGPM